MFLIKLMIYLDVPIKKNENSTAKGFEKIVKTMLKTKNPAIVAKSKKK